MLVLLNCLFAGRFLILRSLVILLATGCLSVGFAQSPTSSAELGWSKSDVDTIKSIRSKLTEDPVSAWRSCSSILNRKKNPPTGPQKKWLKSTMAAAMPRAKKKLQTDFDLAVKNRDLRACVIAMVAAKKLNIILDNSVSKTAIVRNHVLGGGKIKEPIWKVSELEGKLLDGTYREKASGFLGSKVAIEPEPGFKLLRITGKLKNVSLRSDPPYTGVLNVLDVGKVPGKPSRAVTSDMLFLITPDGEQFPCSYICKDASEFRIFSLPRKNKSVINLGSYIPHGKEVVLDVLFSVPQGLKTFKLLVLGASPIEVPIK